MLTTMKRPMRVLVVTGVYPTDEIPHSGTFIKSQVESLIDAGVEVEVIHPRPGSVPIRYISAAIEVFFKTLTGKFDVINGHYGLWCLATRLQWTTPVVASFLGGDLFGELYNDGGSRQKADFVVKVCLWLSKHVDAVIVKSEGMKKLVPDGNTFIVPNGVNFELFRPIPRAEARAALGWEQDRFYVLFGNNPKMPAKNYPLALATMEHLRARGVSAELVVANSLPQTKVVYYINASNALLLPSIYEGSPNIVKELMACNVPIVATDVGDVAALTRRTKGCKTCLSDPEALAVALEEALLHTEPTTGRADIAHLENSLIAEKIIAIFEQVSKNKRKN